MPQAKWCFRLFQRSLAVQPCYIYRLLFLNHEYMVDLFVKRKGKWPVHTLGPLNEMCIENWPTEMRTTTKKLTDSAVSEIKWQHLTDKCPFVCAQYSHCSLSGSALCSCSWMFINLKRQIMKCDMVIRMKLFPTQSSILFLHVPSNSI